jgi:hypothetical protein
MELMLVVLIIGIVYAMALSSFKAPESKELDAFTLMTLPKFLRDSYKLSDAKLVCFEPCGKCSVIVDGQWQEDEVELFTSPDVKSYSLDTQGYANEIEFPPADIDDAYKKACFILHKYPNGSIEPIVLENEGRFIYYKAAYEEVQSYENLSSIQDEYQKQSSTIRNEK